MVRQRFTPEQIIAKLREVDVLVGRGSTAVEACRHIGIAEQTLYRWRKQYGGLKVDQARRMKAAQRRDLLQPRRGPLRHRVVARSLQSAASARQSGLSPAGAGDRDDASLAAR